MYNKVILVGNLIRDVELRYTQSGMAVAVLGLASNRKYKKQDGSQGEEACFIDCKLFGRTAEVANQFLKKGSKVLVEGKLTYEVWEDKNGGKKSKHLISGESLVMLNSSNGGGSQNTQNTQSNYGSQYTTKQTVSFAPTPTQGHEHLPEIEINDDDIPF